MICQLTILKIDLSRLHHIVIYVDFEKVRSFQLLFFYKIAFSLSLLFFKRSFLLSNSALILFSQGIMLDRYWLKGNVGLIEDLEKFLKSPERR